MCCQSGLFVLCSFRCSFIALDTLCLCRLKPITLFWEQWNICVPRWVSAIRGEMIEGKRKGGFMERRMESLYGPSLPRAVLSCSDVPTVGSYSLHSNTVTVRWVCPSCLLKHSHHVFLHLHRKYSAASSIMQHEDCIPNRVCNRLTDWCLILSLRTHS